MKNREEIEVLAKVYAENENSCYTNDFYGFVNGFEECRDEIAKLIMDAPNDEDLGRRIRSEFNKKKLLHDRPEQN